MPPKQKIYAQVSNLIQRLILKDDWPTLLLTNLEFRGSLTEPVNVNPSNQRGWSHYFSKWFMYHQIQSRNRSRHKHLCQPARLITHHSIGWSTRNKPLTGFQWLDACNKLDEMIKQDGKSGSPILLKHPYPYLIQLALKIFIEILTGKQTLCLQMAPGTGIWREIKNGDIIQEHLFTRFIWWFLWL